LRSECEASIFGAWPNTTHIDPSPICNAAVSLLDSSSALQLRSKRGEAEI